MANNKFGFIIVLICLLNIVSTIAEKELRKPKGTVKTLHGKYDVIDCVDIYQQPAFDHPLLKDHKIQISPENIRHIEHNAFEDTVFYQTWNEMDECPEGTVPIKRPEEVDKDFLVKMKGGSVFQQKKRQKGGSIYRNVSKSLSNVPQQEYATATISEGIYYGTKFSATLWNPHVEPNELSLTQTWITAGPTYAPNTIEVGWMVYPHLYKDSRTRLFIYWKTDGYETGCYNLLCDGFVQLSRKIFPGISLIPTSQYGSQNYQVTIAVFKARGNWYLEVNEETVGYWPANIFPFLRNSANNLAWGGQIVNTRNKKHHTMTQMGSGHYANEKYLKAASVFNILVNTREDNPIFERPRLVYPLVVTNSKCYNLQRAHYGNNYKDHFFFGGPGYSNSTGCL